MTTPMIAETLVATAGKKTKGLFSFSKSTSLPLPPTESLDILEIPRATTAPPKKGQKIWETLGIGRKKSNIAPSINTKNLAPLDYNEPNWLDGLDRVRKKSAFPDSPEFDETLKALLKAKAQNMSVQDVEKSFPKKMKSSPYYKALIAHLRTPGETISTKHQSALEELQKAERLLRHEQGWQKMQIGRDGREYTETDMTQAKALEEKTRDALTVDPNKEEDAWFRTKTNEHTQASHGSSEADIEKPKRKLSFFSAQAEQLAKEDAENELKEKAQTLKGVINDWKIHAKEAKRAKETKHSHTAHRFRQAASLVKFREKEAANAGKANADAVSETLSNISEGSK